MRDEDLKDGTVYRLTRDVPNPKVDKRGANLRRTAIGQHEWRRAMPVWPKGMRFIYRHHERSGTIENFDGRYQTEIYQYSLGTDDPEPRWRPLVDAFEPAPETLRIALDRITGPLGFDVRGDLLGVLFDQGKVDEPCLRQAFEEWEKRQEAEEER